ncbi:hypothetical protein ED733_000708 [Metarhizium rileyi]|uniref:Heterokaryon incompatibility domain-containing protein n=1 Tax=Metarhizium rileyi (strain RCEF 4871) TaxID=1649241 RepID=A0A5C6G3W8_METRR|nr:hypothetical protein ED733_000708 [Metarhizium rileyi]
MCIVFRVFVRVNIVGYLPEVVTSIDSVNLFPIFNRVSFENCNGFWLLQVARDNAPLLQHQEIHEWIDFVDNYFATSFFSRVDRRVLLPPWPDFAKLCRPCLSRDLTLPSTDFYLEVSSLSEISETWASCELCGMLSRYLERSGRADQQDIKFVRDGSALRMDVNGPPIFRLCAAPGLNVPKYTSDIQIGFPTLPELGSRIYFELLREWVQVCDEQHEEHGCHSESSGPTLLPSRVLDVGDEKSSNSLHLLCTKKGDNGRYIALSHRWGDPEQHGKFCTHRCNIGALCESIDLGVLPKTFQDAITVTRELGVRFLWIDSLCIVQPHEECSEECRRFDDWDIEAQKMDMYYSSAYCTIAATSARGSSEGFLNPRPTQRCIRVPSVSGIAYYLCEFVDDFRHDVEEGELNQRAHIGNAAAAFTAKHSADYTGNEEADFLGDPQFPKSALQTNKVQLFELLFERYSNFVLTRNTDRSVAISGLERRLAQTFETEVGYGIFNRYLHRSLLWQRSGDERMRRIHYPTKKRKVPSWSWMAYEGGIQYVHVPFGAVEWNDAVHASFAGSQRDNSDHDQQLDIGMLGIELKAPAREFRLFGERGSLVFDEQDRRDIEHLRCIVVGRQKLEVPDNSGGSNADFIVRRPGSPITLGHLLLHTSGLESRENPAVRDDLSSHDLGIGEDSHPLVKLFSLPLVFVPRDGFAYGVGLYWIQYLITVVSGDFRTHMPTVIAILVHYHRASLSTMSFRRLILSLKRLLVEAVDLGEGILGLAAF